MTETPFINFSGKLNGPGPHTFHPNTFGLLYGKTTKTACGKRVKTELLTSPETATCEGCAEVIAEAKRVTDEMTAAALEIVHREGYDSIEEWNQAHPRKRR